MSLSSNIKRLRLEKDMTQEQLAARLGVSAQAVSKWETNLTTPDTYNILQLSRIFRVSVEYLTCGDEATTQVPEAEYIPEIVPEREEDDEEDNEDDSEEREERDKRKFWGFVLFIWGLTSIVRFFNPGIESHSEEWWIKAIVFMIISIPCIFGLKLLFEKK